MAPSMTLRCLFLQVVGMGLVSRFFFVPVSFLSRPVNRWNELKSISVPSRISECLFSNEIFFLTSIPPSCITFTPILWTIFSFLFQLKKNHFATSNQLFCQMVDRSFVQRTRKRRTAIFRRVGVHLGITVFKFKLAHATRRRERTAPFAR